ncbi:hypothetical protein AVEN_118549-1 [Araneus ventricosus]|uniref:Uncharacterized protein n=1 Tax=Araneus ventricosus TaxID=182803 RepID=A0A4Y2AWM6_ARAVE|nr:hypothetical protein AVEN_118549-1 [Araneus ventricosus]
MNRSRYRLHRLDCWDINAEMRPVETGGGSLANAKTVIYYRFPPRKSVMALHIIPFSVYSLRHALHDRSAQRKSIPPLTPSLLLLPPSSSSTVFFFQQS